jgi:ketosteroid isomerase-like protein
VFLPPGDVRTAGKAAVRPWIEGYFKAYTTHWETKVVKFEVSGDWAFVEEIYDSTDTPKPGTPGNVVKDHGKGLDVLHREKDGMWRVVYDVWNSDGAAGK